jgi:hypothetical protein
MGFEIVHPGNTEAAILTRLIQARTEMDPHVAHYLLSLAFEPADVERMNLLAARSSDGELSAEEAAELDSYIHVGNLLSIIQSKARVYLKTHGDSTAPN